MVYIIYMCYIYAYISIAPTQEIIPVPRLSAR